MEECFHGKAKLINAWREGNDPVIAYYTEDSMEEAFYSKFRDPEQIMDDGDVPIIAKEVPLSNQPGED
jgi:hypothetical protein